MASVWISMSVKSLPICARHVFVRMRLVDSVAQMLMPPLTSVTPALQMLVVLVISVSVNQALLDRENSAKLMHLHHHHALLLDVIPVLIVSTLGARLCVSAQLEQSEMVRFVLKLILEHLFHRKYTLFKL